MPVPYASATLVSLTCRTFPLYRLPVIFYMVARPSWQSFRDFRLAVSQLPVRLRHDILLFLESRALPNGRIYVSDIQRDTQHIYVKLRT